MSRTSKLVGRENRLSEEPYSEIGGSFDCQACGEQVEEARNYYNVQLLVWVCEQGHQSRIEFKL